MKSARTKRIQTPTRKHGGMKPHYNKEVQELLDKLTQEHNEHNEMVAQNKARRNNNSRKPTTRQQNQGGIRPLVKLYVAQKEAETLDDTIDEEIFDSLADYEAYKASQNSESEMAD